MKGQKDERLLKGQVCTCGGGEVAHEGGVVVGVGELLLDLALPGHLHQVDGDSVRHHLRSSNRRHTFKACPCYPAISSFRQDA